MAETLTATATRRGYSMAGLGLTLAASQRTSSPARGMMLTRIPTLLVTPARICRWGSASAGSYGRDDASKCREMHGDTKYATQMIEMPMRFRQEVFSDFSYGGSRRDTTALSPLIPRRCLILQCYFLDRQISPLTAYATLASLITRADGGGFF